MKNATKNPTTCPYHPHHAPATGSRFCDECHLMLRRNYGAEVWLQYSLQAEGEQA